MCTNISISSVIHMESYSPFIPICYHLKCKSRSFFLQSSSVFLALFSSLPISNFLSFLWILYYLVSTLGKEYIIGEKKKDYRWCFNEQYILRITSHRWDAAAEIQHVLNLETLHKKDCNLISATSNWDAKAWFRQTQKNTMF